MPGHHQPVRRAGRGVGAVVVGGYVVLDAVIGPIFRPLARLLARVPLLVLLDRGIAKLPPWGALVALAVPFAFAEPAKIFGLYLVGEGHWLWGAITIAAAYLVSLVVVDRIYEAGKPQLMTIGWFATLMTWLVSIKERMAVYVRETRAWRVARVEKARVVRWFSRLRGRAPA